MYINIEKCHKRKFSEYSDNLKVLWKNVIRMGPIGSEEYNNIR